MKRFLSLLTASLMSAGALAIVLPAVAPATTAPASAQSSATGSVTPAYDSLVSPLPGNIPSVGVEAYYFDELGNEVNLANSGPLSNVVVTMSSFACQWGNWYNDTCVTTPGATYSVPITFDIYSVGPGNTPEAVIASDTQTFNIPYRPTADNLTSPAGSNCSGSEQEWYDAAAETCYNGLATNITFSGANFSPPQPSLPQTVIYGISYNTDTNGFSPLGASANSPADSLNIGLSTEPADVTVGSDANPGNLFMAQSAAYTASSEITCATTLPAGVFQSYNVSTTGENCGLGDSSNIPAVEFNVAANAAGTASYDSQISPLPGNIPSVGVEAYYFDELGNEVNLANSGPLSNVVVTMSSYACQWGNWYDDTCVSTPGATYPVPITFNAYTVGPDNTLGTLIATDTQTFNIPYRPTADNLTSPAGSNCPGSEQEWYDAAAETCYNGLATNITFSGADFSPAQPSLPQSIIYGIAYNTDTNGFNPLGPSANSPADSLNISLSTEPADVTVGSDANPGNLFMAQSAADTTSSEITCATTLPAGVFQSYNVSTTEENCGLGDSSNIPAVEINTVSPATVTASLSATSTTVGAVQTVPASAIPLSALTAAQNASAGDEASAPLSSIPLSSIPLSSIPLSSIPLSSIPLSSIALGSSSSDSGIAAAAAALSNIPLSELSVTYPPECTGTTCTGWQGVLAGTTLSGLPLQSVTFGQVLTNSAADSNLDSSGMDLGDLGLSSSPLSSIPLSSIPLSSIPLSSIPLPGTSIPPGSSPSTTETDVLDEWCSTLSGLGYSCANFGIDPNNPSASSATVLSLALAGVPLSSIPLSSIPLSSIPLSSIPLSSIPLSSIPLSSIPLSSIPLSSIPLSSIPLSSIPLSSITLTSTALSVPLSSIPLSSIPLSSIPLSSIPLSSIGNLSTIVNCSSFNCSASGATLGAAASADAVQTGATLEELISGLISPGSLAGYLDTTLGDLGTYASTTLGQLVDALVNPSGTPGYEDTTLAQILIGDNTSAAGYPDLTLGDLILSLVPPQSYPWQDVDLADVPLAQDESAGGQEQYTVPLQVAGAAATVQVTVTLPPTFAYAPGTAKIDGSSAPAPTETSPLTWLLPLSEGAHTLTFVANAGIDLGPATASVTASIATPSASAVASDAGPTASTTVSVFDGEEPDNPPNSATPLAPNTLNLGFMTSATDVNDWSITVSQGQELSLALTNLPAQYDLELFAPAQQQLQGTPSQQLPGVQDTLPSLNLSSTVEATPGSQDIPVTPPSGYQLYALGNVSAAASGYNGTDVGAQFIQTPPLDQGTYIVQVSGYNGATSTQPYLLRAQLLGGGPALECPPLSFVTNEPAAPSSTPTVSPGVNTLFLVDTQRLSAEFGAAAETTILNDIQAVDTDSGAGVNGAVIPVDAYSTVQAAYATWDQDPCSVQAANGVVAAISAVVDSIRASDPSVTNVVIVGADDQIPFARLADGTVASNERDYAAGTFPGENNVEADALADGYYFSDDPFVASAPLGVGSATLYLPTAAIGRLIQSPDQGAVAIENALTRFVSSKGNISATDGLSTGYSFLASGAALVSANLASSGVTMTDLINNTWTTAQLESALTATATPAVDSINAHFDFYGALPAEDNTNGTEANLFTTTAVSGDESAYAGRLLFSMGCHAGLDINTVEVAASGVPPTADWANTFADAGALWVANTGYGYGDSTDIAYSAALMADFAGDLGEPLTIGQALAEAKQQYAAGNAILSPYDLKSMMESTLYGLPMYTLNGATGKAPTAPAPPVLGTDPITGLSEAQVSTSLPVGSGAGQLSEQTGPNGTSYYQVNGTTSYQVNGTTVQNGSTQTTEFRPIEPLYSTNVTEPSSTQPGQLALVAHGALINTLTSQDTTGFTPTISEPDVDSSTPPPQIGNAAFPGSLQRIATYNSFSATGSGTSEQQQLDLIAGQFIPGPSTPGMGTQRLFTKIGAEVLYTSPTSSLATDFTPPTIESSSATVANGNTDFVVTVVPGESAAPVKGVLVLYTSAADPGTWTALDLAPSAGNEWSGAAPNSENTAIEYMVEAVDAAGNVANSTNNGSEFPSSSAPSSTSPDLSISLASSQPPTNGYYDGPVTATVTLGSGASAPVSYVLDGGPSTPLPSSDQVVVTGDGVHKLVVSDAAGDTATSFFDIDTVGPKISSATAPAATANGWVPGVFTGSSGSVLQVDVTDAGAPLTSVSYQESGAQTASGTLSGSSLALPLDLPLTANGSTTVALSAVDQAGLKSSTTVTENVDAEAPTVTCTQPSSSTWFDHNVSVACTVTDNESGIEPSGLYTSYTSSKASFTLTTTLQPGQASALAKTPTATVCSALGDCTTVGPFGPFEVDLAPPTINLTAPTNGAAYTLGQSVKASYSCAATTAGPGIASCTGTVANGAAINTSSPGTYSFTVTATDKAGNVTTVTVSYTVGYALCQVAAPTQVLQTVLFSVYLCNASGTDVTTKTTTITAVSVDGSTKPVPVPTSEGYSFLFVPTPKAFETYLLNVQSLAAGSHTLLVTVANDPVTHSIAFTVKK